MKTLYQALVEAGIPVSNHESDLYFPMTPKTMEILKDYPLESGNRRRFINQASPNVGEMWFDVPFAFDPWWEKRTQTT